MRNMLALVVAIMALAGSWRTQAYAPSLEERYRAIPDAAAIGRYMQRLSARHLKVTFNWDTKPLYNVVATLRGSTFPDEWIIRGNHHDAWVNGAGDPVSGLAPELEEARALGRLVKDGWRPRRTIVYTAWDGEEAGLITPHRGSGNKRHGLGALEGTPHRRWPVGSSRGNPLEGQRADWRARIRIRLHAISPASRRRVVEPVLRRV
jgi:hypothetical protein